MPGDGERGSRRSFSWIAVVGILFVTCIGMLGAIWWVVRSARP
ncbi:MAG TPA: hypothetical protein VHE30_06240 [Polyangiaceae bacterium]|nr:hypothetical protein [Polyangiaceae bacterium]